MSAVHVYYGHLESIIAFYLHVVESGLTRENLKKKITYKSEMFCKMIFQESQKISK